MADLKKLIRTKNVSDEAQGRRLNILFATAEVAPFSKTGGLADVAASLPKALARRGHRVSILTPLYRHIDPVKQRFSRRLTTLEVPRKAKSQRKIEATVWETRLAAGVNVFFVDCPEYFEREGLYGYDSGDFEDNAERYAFFSRAAVEFARQFTVPVDVLHCQDWHSALAPVYHDYYYRDDLAQVATLLTLHNVAYQGTFDEAQFDATGLPKGTFASESELFHDGKMNFLKGGILHADKVTTVSPTYADELTEDGGGFGLGDVLRERGDDLVGILNGADYGIWSPETDLHIAVNYDREELNGKRRNKAELQHRMGLPVRPVLPLVSFVGRLTEQKGLDILIPALRRELEGMDDERSGFQMLLLGDGEAKYQEAITKLAEDFPRRVAARVGYDDELAHHFFAGSDVLVVPSHFEPCGLTQIYAMRYGTVPVVHAVGGLADTVTDIDDDPKGTGFVFDEYTTDDLADALARATERYRHHRQWRPLMVRAMEADFSWERSALRYEDLYREAVANARGAKK